MEYLPNQDFYLVKIVKQLLFHPINICSSITWTLPGVADILGPRTVLANPLTEEYASLENFMCFN